MIGKEEQKKLALAAAYLESQAGPESTAIVARINDSQYKVTLTTPLPEDQSKSQKKKSVNKMTMGQDEIDDFALRQQAALAEQQLQHEYSAPMKIQFNKEKNGFEVSFVNPETQQTMTRDISEKEINKLANKREKQQAKQSSQPLVFSKTKKPPTQPSASEPAIKPILKKPRIN